MRGVRARLTATLVALVALTAFVLGVGSWLFVDTSLRSQRLTDAADQARFDLGTLIPGTLPPGEGRPGFDRSGLARTLAQRGVEVIARFPDDPPSPFVDGLPPTVAAAVARGEVAYAWTTAGTEPVLVTAGRSPGIDAEFYFLHDVTDIEDALATLRSALVVGGVVLALLALLAARRVARGVLAPVEEAARAAARIERGDLSARVPVASRDEFGDWAERFNAMAATLEETFGRLEASQAQNRRFVADVAHELRTPLTGLVAEASILREHLDALPPDARRTGELLVADVARLRTLVDELMELSRFDAAAEAVAAEPVDLGRLVRQIVEARAPEASIAGPEERVTVATEPRRLERILGNLLDNAREHAPGAPIEVRVRSRDAWAIVEVLDRGPGVPEDRLDRIFDRFYKADPSRRGGSSGLGLAIAAEHASILGGAMRARNRPDGGLRIAVRLPRDVTDPLPERDRPATASAEHRTPRHTAPEPDR
jgi:signal transduction histidine kinase